MSAISKTYKIKKMENQPSLIKIAQIKEESSLTQKESDDNIGKYYEEE